MLYPTRRLLIIIERSVRDDYFFGKIPTRALLTFFSVVERSRFIEGDTMRPPSPIAIINTSLSAVVAFVIF